MTTFTSGTSGSGVDGIGFSIAQFPGTPRQTNSNRAIFGMDRFGIPLFTVVSGATSVLGLQAVRFASFSAVDLVADTQRTMFVYENTGGDGVSGEYLIPQPVGTGTTRGVMCSSATLGTYYILCTQTPPA